MKVAYETGASMARLRRDEATAFTRLAETFETHSVPSVETTRAAHVTRRVWTALIRDLGDAANGYPDALKAQLIGLGFSMMREADAVLNGDGEAAARLAELCRTFADGLAVTTSEAA